MQVLVNEYAGSLLDARSAQLGDDVELVRLIPGGRLLVDGHERALADVHPEVAFASAHVLTDGSAPTWLALSTTCRRCGGCSRPRPGTSRSTTS